MLLQDQHQVLDALLAELGRRDARDGGAGLDLHGQGDDGVRQKIVCSVPWPFDLNRTRTDLFDQDFMMDE